MRFWVYLLVSVGLSSPLYSQVVLNEIVSKNESVLVDDFQNYSDWIELYNTAMDSVLLSAYFLSDDINDPFKWQLSDDYILAKSHVVLFASDKNQGFHANFKISSQGEALYLSHLNVGIVDSFPPVPLLADQSFGRYPDGGAPMGILQAASPNAPNNSISHAFSALYFAPSEVFHQHPFGLKILASNPTATIRYTTNGEMPTVNSTLYSDSLFLSSLDKKPNDISEIPTAEQWYPPKENVFKAHVLRAAAFMEGRRISQVYTKTYFVDKDIVGRYHFPIISLVTENANLFDNDSGIYVKGNYTNYYQRGRDWERPVHFEYIDLDGNLKVHQPLGLRAYGNKGRTLAQKSLLLYARESYGKKRLNHPFYKDKDSFKRLIVRSASSNDWKNTLFKNELAQKVVRDLDLEHPSSQEVIVFINGEYWGIHHLNERMDEYFICDYFGIENIDLLSADAKVEEGSNSDFLALKQYLQSSDLSRQEHYLQIQQWIDVDNLIDYYCAQLFFSNTDWPHNNIKFWKAQENGKWRWLFFDCDECMSYEHYELLGDFIGRRGVRQDFPQWSTYLMHHLFKNQSFRRSFRYRFEELLATTFSAENLMKHIDQTKALYAPHVQEHCMRWSMPNDINDWLEVVDGLYSFASLRPTVMREQLKDYFGNPFSIYPNPSKGFINIELSVPDQQFERLTIKNSIGKEVMSFENHWPKPMEVRHLNAGVYFLQIQLQGHLFTERLLIL